MIRLLLLPVKLLVFVTRVIGPTRLLFFLLGVAIGLLVAPTTGRELRQRLQDRLAASSMDSGTPLSA